MISENHTMDNKLNKTWESVKLGNVVELNKKSISRGFHHKEIERPIPQNFITRNVMLSISIFTTHISAQVKVHIPLRRKKHIVLEYISNRFAFDLRK